jgi:hypothetical protein
MQWLVVHISMAKHKRKNRKKPRFLFGPPQPYKYSVLHYGRLTMIYASPAWEFAANTHLLKLQRLQNKVLHTIGNFPRCTPVRVLHKAFNIPYIYDYITKLCRQQAGHTKS